jgi:hypothetical protein
VKTVPQKKFGKTLAGSCSQCSENEVEGGRVATSYSNPVKERSDTRYSEDEIRARYSSNLEMAKNTLGLLPLAEGRTPQVNGLNGWIFEQTIRSCLSEELRLAGRCDRVTEQQPLQGKARIDLLVGTMAVELKKAGWFGDDSKRYAKYRVWAQQKGWSYAYLTLGESHRPYRIRCEEVFGQENEFFLDTPGDWGRFVDRATRHTPALERAADEIPDERRPLDLDDVLNAFALRFDGWKYAQSMAPNSNDFFPPLVDPVIRSGTMFAVGSTKRYRFAPVSGANPRFTRSGVILYTSKSSLSVAVLVTPGTTKGALLTS